MAQNKLNALLDVAIWVDLPTKQKPTAKISRPKAHKKMPTGQKPTKQYSYCTKCGLLAVSIWLWAFGFGELLAVGFWIWWAYGRGLMAVGFWPWAFGRGLLAVGFWPWAFGHGLLAVSFWL